MIRNVRWLFGSGLKTFKICERQPIDHDIYFSAPIQKPVKPYREIHKISTTTHVDKRSCTIFLQATGVISCVSSIFYVQYGSWLLSGDEPDCSVASHVHERRSTLNV